MVGLQAEARIARRLTAHVSIGQPHWVIRPEMILSFGLAGGLDPALRPGALIVPRSILSGDQRVPLEAPVLAALGGATHDLLLAADEIVGQAAQKHALWRVTGASAVDMESGAVARAARAAGIPFGALRAICDPAERDLPPAASIALDAKGAIGFARVVASVLKNPGQIAALVALAQDAARARRALLDGVGDLRRRHMA